MNHSDAIDGGLAQGAWRPEIHAALLDIINAHGSSSPTYDPQRPPIAAFDCDETLICNDIGEAMMRYMVARRRFHADRGFWQIIPDRMGREAIQAAYNAIAGRTDAEVKDTAAFRRFRAGLLGAYETLRANEGSEAAYVFAVRLLRGLSDRAVNEIVEEVIEYELGRPLASEDIQGGPPFQGMVVPTGIRFYREMQELIGALDAYGFHIYIVSASNAHVVRALARRVGIPPERVIGIELTSQGNGFGDRVVEPVPAGEGKREALLDIAGRSPVLAIGDSMTDFEMLENCDGLSIVIDRGDEEMVERALEMGWMVQPGLSV